MLAVVWSGPRAGLMHASGFRRQLTSTGKLFSEWCSTRMGLGTHNFDRIGEKPFFEDYHFIGIVLGALNLTCIIEYYVRYLRNEGANTGIVSVIGREVLLFLSSQFSFDKQYYINYLIRRKFKFNLTRSPETRYKFETRTLCLHPDLPTKVRT